MISWDWTMIPQLISTGLPDIMMPVSSLEVLDRIEPDFPALSKLSERYEVVGVHAFTVNCDDATCHVRNFAPLYDIDEEAATGTSNGALTDISMVLSNREMIVGSSREKRCKGRRRSSATLRLTATTAQFRSAAALLY